MIADVQIAPLYQRPDLAHVTAELFCDIWSDHYGSDGRGDVQADLRARCRPTGPPFALVAFTADGQVVGSVSMERHSYGSGPDEEPWLIGLCVRPDMRGAGLASRLVQELERHAAAQGHVHLYTTTHTATGLLKRLDWAPLRNFDADGVQWNVMHKSV